MRAIENGPLLLHHEKNTTFVIEPKKTDFGQLSRELYESTRSRRWNDDATDPCPGA